MTPPKTSMSFVPRTVFPKYNIPLNNFKGHHQKALSKFGHLAPQIDMIIEVRDCRAPIATTNVLFDRVLVGKKKLILYSKKDMSILKTSVLDKWHKLKNEDYMFIDCRSRKDGKKIINQITKLYESMDPPPPLGLRSMIIGMPNVGKSTLVNTLRQVGLNDDAGAISSRVIKVARTGNQPGVTRNTSEIIRLCRDPDIMVYDTPGVFMPTAKNVETMLALGLVGCIHDSFIDPVVLADYLLFVLNLQDPSGKLYSEYIDHPTNDIYELLDSINAKRNRGKDKRRLDEDGLAMHWVSNWKNTKSNKYRGLFDVEAIKQGNEKTFSEIIEKEKERMSKTNVQRRLTDRFGDDGTSTDKHRQRTAKDREFDLRNRLFKL
ncbi:Mitochondrial GTPase 1 [Candida viswanathii]|uniref:Mitochondrial GTPase 1 n=1 Tax=Candida viswanathii TaxID=5486 RepID=A0A367Y992_9ASCO|nr:Mitochondrial GTPase 1 [Candida viswanathii]